MTRRFIDNTILLVTGSNIGENCKMLKEVYQLCTDWATKYAPKFDSSKYWLVHLLQKKNADLNRDLILNSNHKIKAQNLGILLGVKIDN